MAVELEMSAIVGIALMALGGTLVAWGLVLCYTTKVDNEHQHVPFHNAFLSIFAYTFNLKV